MTAPITLQLEHKQPEAGNVWSFRFRPSEPLDWLAGQFIRVELPHTHPDAEGTKRYFTIASAPHEGHVQISTRITDSSFKQTLAQLPIGRELLMLDPPAGDFVWPTSPVPLIFAAQGIGITPFYSMLKSRLHHGQPLTATLFYTNRSADIPFRAELEGWAAQHPEFRLILSEDRINAATISRLNSTLAASRVYVSGPGNLIALLGPPFNLKPSQLKQDFFPNYAASVY
jgi:ferredoxin-NADP reductase